jgi:hypothetical protein
MKMTQKIIAIDDKEDYEEEITEKNEFWIKKN